MKKPPSHASRPPALIKQQAAPRPARLEAVDALRGLALVWMLIYHFSFDLNLFGHIRQDFYRDPWWTTQRTLIVSLFLLCAGMGQALAVAQGLSWRRFWQRWAQIAGCALLVSIGSWGMFPHSWISFGVLHGMVVMLPLTRWLLRCCSRRGAVPWLVAAAAPIAAAPLGAAWLPAGAPAWLVAALDSRWLNGLGLVSHKPVTEDYVPLLPWLGAMLLGAALGRWVLQRDGRWMPRRLNGAGRALALLGRWSLSFYMLHQPLLIGALLVWRALG